MWLFLFMYTLHLAKCFAWLVELVFPPFYLLMKKKFNATWEEFPKGLITFSKTFKVKQQAKSPSS